MPFSPFGETACHIHCLCGGPMNLLQRIIDLYVDGFRNMTVGKSLWLLIIIKLFLIFIVLKLFFFPNFLNTNFSTDEERAQHVRSELIGNKR